MATIGSFLLSCGLASWAGALGAALLLTTASRRPQAATEPPTALAARRAQARTLRAVHLVEWPCLVAAAGGIGLRFGEGSRVSPALPLAVGAMGLLLALCSLLLGPKLAQLREHIGIAFDADVPAAAAAKEVFARGSRIRRNFLILRLVLAALAILLVAMDHPV